MEMKIAITSYTGKCGKSTVANNLLYPRMREAEMFRLETVNESGASGAEDEKKMKGRDLEKLQNGLSKTKSAIVDVGASNIESFILALHQQDDAHFDFDLFLVPVVASAAAQNEMSEAVKTLQVLAGMGIEAERIKVVFNKLPLDADLEDEVRVLLNFHKKNPIFTLNKNAVIHDSPAFKSLGTAKKSYVEMLADETDYRQKLKDIPYEPAYEKERTATVALMRAQGYVKTLDREMNQVFEALFGEE